MQRMDHTPSLAMPPSILLALARCDRSHLEAFVEIAIDMMNSADMKDDPDEPEFSPRSDGCPGDIGDHEPGGDDEAGAYVEWHSKSPSRQRSDVTELAADGALYGGSMEDDEDSFEDLCEAADDGCGSRLHAGNVVYGSDWEDESE